MDKNTVSYKLKNISSEFTILYVEDEIELQHYVSRYLNNFFKKVDIAVDGEDGLNLYKKNRYDIVITDINMPVMSGLEMLKEIKSINEEQNTLVISAYSDTKNFIDSIKLGVDGYILKPITFEQLNSELFKIVSKIKNLNENIEYKKNLEKMVLEKTNSVKKLEYEKVDNYKKILYALVKMIEDRDTYTGGHSMRVARYSKLVAERLELSEEIVDSIYQAGILHDIGKIAIPDNILLKPGGLNNLEYTLIKEHVSIGVSMISEVPMLVGLSKIIEGHHERLDGSGYPKRLKGDEILLESQIMAVADVFDAMTTSRVYNDRKSVDEALSEIKSLEDIHFRSDVVKSAVDSLKDIFIDDNITQAPTTALEKERFSYFYKDQIIQCYNSDYLEFILIQNKHKLKYKYLYLISLKNLELINTKYDWERGDKYLIDVYKNLDNLYPYPSYEIFKVFSYDFAILAKEELSINTTILHSFISIDGITFTVHTFDMEKEKIEDLNDLSSYR
ncbi:MAG: response regulator [Campylobacterota bacterium]|nr:response regulator [Campylobacterota bacterium]